MPPNRRPGRQEQRRLRGPAAVQPTARPVDTFMGPTESRADPQAAALAQVGDSLRGIQPSINQHLSLRHLEFTDEQRQQAKDDFLKTRKPWKQAVEEGLVDPAASPWYRLEYDRTSGYAAVEDAHRQAYLDYTEDPISSSDNLDEVRGWFQQRLAESVPVDEDASPWFREAVAEASEGSISSLMDRHVGERNEAIKEDFSRKVDQHIGTVMDEFASLSDHGELDDSRLDDVQAYVDDTVESGFGSSQMVKSLVDRIGMKAEEHGNPELVKLLDRLKVNGTPLKDTPYGNKQKVVFEQYADAERTRQRRERYVSSIADFRKDAALGRLDEEEFQAFREANPDIIDGGEAEQYIAQSRIAHEREMARAQGSATQQRRLEQRDRLKQRITAMMDQGSESVGGSILRTRDWTFQDEGGEWSISGEALVEEAIEETMAEIDETYEGEEALNRKLDFLSSNGVTYDVFRAQLRDGHIGLSPHALAKLEVDPETGDFKGSPNARSMSAYNLFKQMHAKDPALLRRHIGSGEAYDVFKHAMEFEEYIAKGQPEVALMHSLRAYKNREYRGIVGTEVDQETAERAIQDITESGWGPWKTTAPNFGDVNNSLGRRVRQYVGLGFHPDAALEIAQEQISEEWTNVGGWMVRTANINLPENLGELVSMARTEVFEANKGLWGDEISEDDLTLIPMDEQGNVWQVVDGNTMDSPIGAGRVQYTMQELQEKHATRQAKEAERRRARDLEQAEAKAEASLTESALSLFRNINERGGRYTKRRGFTDLAAPLHGDQEGQIPLVDTSELEEQLTDAHWAWFEQNRPESPKEVAANARASQLARSMNVRDSMAFQPPKNRRRPTGVTPERPPEELLKKWNELKQERDAAYMRQVMPTSEDSPQPDARAKDLLRRPAEFLEWYWNISPEDSND